MWQKLTLLHATKNIQICDFLTWQKYSIFSLTRTIAERQNTASVYARGLCHNLTQQITKSKSKIKTFICMQQSKNCMQQNQCRHFGACSPSVRKSAVAALPVAFYDMALFCVLRGLWQLLARLWLITLVHSMIALYVNLALFLRLEKK